MNALETHRHLMQSIERLDSEIRDIVPKCAACNRPDGGIVRSGRTPFEDGLVDRRRCPDPACPMREHAATHLIVFVGEPAQ